MYILTTTPKGQLWKRTSTLKISILKCFRGGGGGRGWGGRGRRGFFIQVMRLVIVSQLAFQPMFQLSNPGVPRTFVVDSRFQLISGWMSRLFSSKIFRICAQTVVILFEVDAFLWKENVSCIQVVVCSGSLSLTLCHLHCAQIIRYYLPRIS